MVVVLGLLTLFVLLDVAVLAGWAPSTRDGRDWNVPNEDPHHHDSLHTVGSVR